MIRQHDLRDWAQRKPRCHAYLAHRSSILRDGWWQLHCELKLAHPPELVLERRVAEDRFYRAIDRGWMAQQLPWAALFLTMGGMPWLLWGIAARIAASVSGHWLVGYFAHNRGPRSWHLEGAGVQGYNGALLRTDHHGRGLAQQPPRLPGFGAAGAQEGGGRSGMVGSPWACKARPRLGPQDAGRAAAPAQPHGAAALRWRRGSERLCLRSRCGTAYAERRLRSSSAVPAARLFWVARRPPHRCR